MNKSSDRDFPFIPTPPAGIILTGELKRKRDKMIDDLIMGKKEKRTVTEGKMKIDVELDISDFTLLNKLFSLVIDQNERLIMCNGNEEISKRLQKENKALRAIKSQIEEELC